ncbi:MAG: ABC transporter permease, partial [Lachnospiraceae bacterium]|nr:ABC transporter permease [Lachnospiraceae bacterium]
MLIRKVIRDLRINAIQFLAIFVMTALAMLVVSGFDSSDNGVYESAARFFTDTNYKDLSVLEGDFTQYDIDRVKNIDGVSNVNGVIHSNGKVQLDTERAVAISYIEGNDVCSMYLVEGEEYTPGSDGVWVEYLFAEPRGIKLGDTLAISTQNTTLYEKVKGIVYSPMYVYYIPNDDYIEPEYGNHGFLIMDISEALGEEKYFDELMIDLTDVKGQGMLLTDEDRAVMSRMRGEVAHKFDDSKVLVKLKTEDDTYDAYVGDIESNNSLSVVFPLIFIMVAMLGIITTMTRLTSNQRTQIGTLKALGFSRRTITLHYLSYTFIVTLLGGVVGLVLGVFTLGQYLNDLNDYYYQNPYIYLKLTQKSYIMLFVAVALSLFITYVSTRKLLIQNASEILRPETPKGVGMSSFEKTGLWQRISFASRWNIRDVRKNKLRTAVSVLGIIVCSQLLYTAVGFYECLHSQSVWMYEDLIVANTRIMFNPGTARETVRDYANEYSGQMIEYDTVTLFADNMDSVKTMTVVDDGNLYLMQNTDMEYVDIPESGVVLTSKMIDHLGLDVGDVIRFRVAGDDNDYSAPIVAISKQASDQGIVLSRKAWEECGGDFTPNMIYTRMTVPTTLKQQDPVVNSVETIEKLKEGVETSNEIGYSITVILIVMAVTMGVVVLYNLGELSYIEKIREIATLKVLGFQSGFIRLILLQQNLTITFIGAVFGVPAGYGTLYLLLDL